MSPRILFFLVISASLTAQSLFDGHTTAGWQTLAGPEFPTGAWQVENGALCSIASGPRADLSSKGLYRNFELDFEWWLAKGANGGVKYLVFGQRPNPATGKMDRAVPKALGLELQLIDDERVADAKVAASHGTGALYLYVAPSNLPPLAVEQWHKARIVVRGKRIEHWLDGVKVVEADLESDSLREAMANQKRADVPKPHHLDELKQHPEKRYPVVLTHHGGHTCYRNLRLRELK